MHQYRAGRTAYRRAKRAAQLAELALRGLLSMAQDVTAFVTHGRNAESNLIDFGLAHNIPNNKRKLN